MVGGHRLRLIANKESGNMAVCIEGHAWKGLDASNTSSTSQKLLPFFIPTIQSVSTTNLPPGSRLLINQVQQGRCFPRNLQSPPTFTPPCALTQSIPPLSLPFKRAITDPADLCFAKSPLIFGPTSSLTLHARHLDSLLTRLFHLCAHSLPTCFVV